MIHLQFYSGSKGGKRSESEEERKTYIKKKKLINSTSKKRGAELEAAFKELKNMPAISLSMLTHYLLLLLRITNNYMLFICKPFYIFQIITCYLFVNPSNFPRALNYKGMVRVASLF